MISLLLLHPPDHPLYDRIVRQPGTTSYPIWGGIVLAVLSCCGFSMFLVNLQTYFGILFFTMLFMMSTGTVIGWAANIAAALVRERERQTYDTLAVTPAGSRSIDLAVCTASLHGEDTLSWTTLIRAFFSALLLLLLLTAGVTIAFRLHSNDLGGLISLFVIAVVLALVAGLDHLQAVVLGSLAGMLVPYYAQNSLDARVRASGSFLLLQAVSFIAAILTSRVLSPVGSNPTGLLAGVVVFYLLREVMIAALWQGLRNQWNDEADR